MRGHRFCMVALALANLLTAGYTRAQEMDARIESEPSGQPCILKDDIEPNAKEVARLKPGDEVTVYLAVSTPNHYFVKVKTSPPGEGSGWIPRSRVKAAAPEACVRSAAPAAKREAAAAPPPAPAPVSTPAILDIPQGHWARHAVEELARSGLIRVPEGKFDGDRPASRYELAVVTHRVLDKSHEEMGEINATLRKFAESADKHATEMKKFAHRLDEVEKGSARKQSAEPARDGSSAASSEELNKLSRSVASLRQAFTKSMAGLALDRSKMEEYQAGWRRLLERIEKMDRRLQAEKMKS